MKLSIGIPCFDHVATDFAFSLAGLTHLIGRNSHPFTIIAPRSFNIVDARNEIVRQALANGSTHILFLDSDMKFPADTFYRLLSHAKPICGAYGVKRKFPIERCGEPLDRWADAGVFEMESMGMAVCLINTEIFKRMPLPVFEWSDVSEDVGFCRKARAVGLKIWCDADLSNEIGHVGSHVFQ